MWAHNYGLQDFGDLRNALHYGRSEQANVAFHLRWSGARKRVHEVNEEQGYEGRFIRTGAHIQWRSVQSGFSFISEPASESRSVFSQIGHERNGVYFRH